MNEESLRREEVSAGARSGRGGAGDRFRLLLEIDGASFAGLVSREARLAFWINTYNALVTEGISAFGLRHSVWEVPDFFQRIGCRIGDRVFTADEIEHGVLRGNRPGPLSAPGPPHLLPALSSSMASQFSH